MGEIFKKKKNKEFEDNEKRNGCARGGGYLVPFYPADIKWKSIVLRMRIII